MSFKCNGVYICSLVEKDFIPGNFFNKNSRLKLVGHAVNQAGKPSNSIFSMLDTHFFVSFYSKDDVIFSAAFGYTFMRPFDIADSFIGSTTDSFEKMTRDCSNFRYNPSLIKFNYKIVDEDFEVMCFFGYQREPREMYESILEVYVENKTRKISASGMKFRFVRSMDNMELESRDYKEK